MNEELRSILLGTAGLDVAGGLALYLTLTRGNVESSPAQLHSAVRLVMVAILLQAAHFVEECATGFPARFPELLGLSAWSLIFFVSFNVSCPPPAELAAPHLPVTDRMTNQCAGGELGFVSG